MFLGDGGYVLNMGLEEKNICGVNMLGANDEVEAEEKNGEKP